MSATFRCLRSGHTVTFTEQVDIDSMKFHPDYEPVVAPAPVEQEVKKTVGRPPKKTESNHEGE